LQQEIWPAISVVVKLLEHSNKNIRRTAIDCLSSLGAQGTYSLFHFEPFALLRPLLSELAAGGSASNFRGGEIAAALQRGYLPSCD
jgi:hypothetical protein